MSRRRVLPILVIVGWMGTVAGWTGRAARRAQIPRLARPPALQRTFGRELDALRDVAHDGSEIVRTRARAVLNRSAITEAAVEGSGGEQFVLNGHCHWGYAGWCLDFAEPGRPAVNVIDGVAHYEEVHALTEDECVTIRFTIALASLPHAISVSRR